MSTAGSSTLSAVPRVRVQHLMSLSPDAAYETCVESLSLAIAKHNVCVVRLHESASVKAACKTFGQLFATMPEASSSQFEAHTPGSPGHTKLSGCNRFEYRLGAEAVEALPAKCKEDGLKAFTGLDSAARLVMGALCRSCHMRLHSATFATILDEVPLLQGTVSSSTLHIIDYDTAHAALPQPRGSQAGPSGLAAVEEFMGKGLITVVAAHAGQPPSASPTGTAPRASCLQVKNSAGQWVSVMLEEGEVAIMLGHTLHRATAGLLQPASYRLAGNLSDRPDRQVMVFELRARPSACIDFQTVLAEAGHDVSERLATPMSMRELMQQFDAVLSPFSAVKSAATSARLSAFCLTSRRRGHKRAALETPGTAPSSPVTRSGRVRRVAGALRTQKLQRSQVSLGDAMPARSGAENQDPASSSSGEGACTAMQLVSPRLTADSGRRVCLDVGLSGREPASALVCLLFTDVHGGKHWVRARRTCTFGSLFEAYSSCLGLQLGDVKFLHNGKRVYGANTPSALGVADEDQLMVVPFDYGATAGTQ